MVRHTKFCKNCGKCLDRRHRTKFCSEKCVKEYNLNKSRAIAKKK